MVCTKVTERMALDILRAASSEDRSVSEFLYLLVRKTLYGTIVRLGDSPVDIQGHTR